MFTDHFKEYATVNRFKIFQFDPSSMDDNTIIIDKKVNERIAKDFCSVKIKPEPVEKEIRFVKNDQPVVKFRQYLLNEYALYRLETLLVFSIGVVVDYIHLLSNSPTKSVVIICILILISPVLI
jgi:hypothetical protein